MQNKNKILVHLIYWVIIRSAIFYAYTFPYYSPKGEALGMFWVTTLLAILVEVLEFYVYYKVLVPKYILEKRNLLLFFICFLFILIISSGLRHLLWNQYNILQGDFNHLGMMKNQLSTHLEISTFYPILAFVAIIIETWVGSELKKNKLTFANTESQINFLKSQINPHFIFNTLNNIYALSLKDNEKTALALSKLQNTFGFLEKVEHSKTVLVSEGLEYIKSFIELSKLRISRPNQVELILEDSQYQEYSIFPMLMVPFVENAFKHTNLQDDSDFIKIEIKLMEKAVFLSVQNTFTQANYSKDAQKGIGIKNVIERLNLLYPDKTYSLVIDMKTDVYDIKLVLPYAEI